MRARLVIDRIVSDKTFCNATISRSFFKKILRDLRSPKQNSAREACEQFETSATALTAGPASDSSALSTYDSQQTRRIQFFSGSSFLEDAAVLS